MEEDNKKRQIGFNTACENFRQNIINVINNANLPIAPVYYLMHSLEEEIEKTYYAVLNQEGSENPIELGKDEEEENSN